MLKRDHLQLKKTQRRSRCAEARVERSLSPCHRHLLITTLVHIFSELRWTKQVVVICLACFAFVSTNETVRAQPMNFVAGVEETENQSQLPFLLPVQPTEIGEAIEDFRRFSGRKQWEKAFKHLEKVFNSTANGLVLTDNGIMLPSRLIAREALLELPPAGQDAYRLFFDAEAKKLLEQAKDGEELTKLTQIFSRYLITSVGDEAANRLGDLHFEAGNFAQAINSWRAILEERPDSKLSKARLRIKIGTALARLRRWTELRDVLRVSQEQHASEKLTVGGQEVSVVEHLRALSKRAGDAVVPTSQSAQQTVADFSLSGKLVPLWQFRFFPNVDPNDGNSQPGLRLQQMWGGVSYSDVVPPVVVDNQFAYVNLLGYDVAVDLKDGKLNWRSGRFFDLVQKAQQGAVSSMERFGIAKGTDRLWMVTMDLKGQNQGQMMGRNGGGETKFEIVSRETATGKQIFSSQTSNELKEWSLRGKPIASGDRVYVAANKNNQGRELYVLALNVKDGKVLWSTQIGSYTSEQNYYYYGQPERGTHPSLVLEGDRLYVDTHAGTLIQMESVGGQIDWGLNYASESQQGNGRFWNPWGMKTEKLTVSPPQIINGILYVKGMRSSRLYAVDPLRPKVLWHRPIPKIATFIGVDDKNFYLGGEEISAFDLATRKIVWSAQVGLGTAFTTELMTEGRIYHFSPRGLYEIDKSNGKVVHIARGADTESLGGEIVVTPNALLTVSNLAITAYPLRNEKPITEKSAAIETKDRGTTSN